MDSDPQLKSRIGSVGNQFAIMTIIALLTSVPLMFMKEVGPCVLDFMQF